MKVKVSDLIVDFLADKGIKHCFAVTGGGAMHLNDSFGSSSRIKCIYNNHEQACSIGAEGYCRASGLPAVVNVTSGPGGTNAITGVMGAWLDSIPMFVLSGQVKFSTTIASVPHLTLRQLGDQEFNIISSVKNMTKYAVMIDNEQDILYHLEKAWYLMTEGRPAPVWLDVPLNIQGAIVETDNLRHFDVSECIAPEYDDFCDNEITKLYKLLDSTKSPVLFAGTAIRNCGYTDKFIKLAEKLDIPVVTAWNANDSIPHDHRLYAGLPGTVGTRGGNFVVQNADLLIVIGSQLNIRQISYNWENFACKAKLVVVDIDKNELNKPTLSIDWKINTDLRIFIDKLLDSEQNKTVNHSKWIDWAKNINAKYPVNTGNYKTPDNTCNPYEFFDKLSYILGDDDVIVCSNGAACVQTFQGLRIKGNQRIFTNSGCASMGYGLPASIGAAVSMPKRRVVCIEGDGSLQMNIQELGTVAEYGFNDKIIVLNNNGYHSIRQTQSNLFKHHPLCGVNRDSGVGIPDTEKIAYAYGIKYYKLDNINNLKNVVSEFLNGGNAAILEVMLDVNQNFEPKLSSRVLPDGTMISATLDDMYPFLDRDEYESIKFEG